MSDTVISLKTNNRNKKLKALQKLYFLATLLLNLIYETQMANINIFYEKTNQYRTIYTDGLVGGITPTNDINLNFYATRNSIPKCVTHKISPDGEVDINGIKSDDSTKGIIREIEVGVYMNKNTARDIYKFLKQIFKDENDEIL